uniref:Uncharacterized protein n=1 Tax=Avena sativa TaxID=4498 RepID=A0ACD5XNK6_AVESA
MYHLIGSVSFKHHKTGLLDNIIHSPDSTMSILFYNYNYFQAYIEAENKRLENDPSQFSAKEIIIRIDYKHCPNLTIIDTPGLILAAPGRKNRVLQSQACAVEALVRAKIQHKETIILCLEDCSDWSNATTRRVVMQVDPDLARTVLVSTKLDTKIPQFARASDVEVFLHPPTCVLDGSLLGDSPFFTSVPSGRVGSCHEAVFRSNEDFKKAISLRELDDVTSLEDKLGRSLTREEKNRIGVSNLRLFLEELLQNRYIESVPSIIPLLEKEQRAALRKLRKVTQETSHLNEAKLKEKARLFHDSFLTKLSLLLKGMVVAPPDKFGETLINKRVNGGTFTGSENFQLPNKMMPNAGMRLYGGAQYHRAMAEFRLVVGSIKCPPITREEIVNACGVEDIHDGTNYSRTACVIAVAKARDTFEPFLHQLSFRLLYVLKRLSPISVFLLAKDDEHFSSHDVLVKRVQAAFDKFAESTEQSCRERCMEDLESTTRYVTWSLHNKNRAGLRHFLDSFVAPEQHTHTAHSAGLHEQSSGLNDNKQDRPKGDLKSIHSPDSNPSSVVSETRLNIKSVAIGAFIPEKESNSKAAPGVPTGAAPSTGTASASAPPPSSSSSTSSEKLKVQNYGKSSKELTGLYMSQEIQAHEGSIWSIKFSADGRRLASAGEDSVVRVWEVVETSAPAGSVPQDGSLPPLPIGGTTVEGSTPALTKKSTTKAGKSAKDTLPEHLVVPDKVFALAEQPLCVLEGHDDDVLDLTWSKSDQLLSSSMDKTVRLWDTTSKTCLKKFSHSDYVTSIQFNPVDDRYFISGSLDAKVRLWSIPNRQVVDWTDVNEMVTATSYTPDGQGAIIGSHQGSCRFYKTADCKLSPEAQIEIDAKKKKSQAKKITGFQFSPANSSEVLVTSADSQIRVFDGVTLVQKFRGR